MRILNWDWRRDRSGAILAVYGVVQNQGDRDLRNVVLEFRAQDTDGNPTGTATITVEDLAAGQKKPFRQDLPPTGKEVMAFLEVRKASPKYDCAALYASPREGHILAMAHVPQSGDRAVHVALPK